MREIFGLLLILAVILVIIFGPFITIWSLNTLFPSLAIAYTFNTWVASLLLFGGGLIVFIKR